MSGVPTVLASYAFAWTENIEMLFNIHLFSKLACPMQGCGGSRANPRSYGYKTGNYLAWCTNTHTFTLDRWVTTIRLSMFLDCGEKPGSSGKTQQKQREYMQTPHTEPRRKVTSQSWECRAVVLASHHRASPSHQHNIFNQLKNFH